MTLKRNKRIFWCLAAVFVCLAALSLCMTSCRLPSSNAGASSPDDHPSMQEDAYEAKILYYETKLQNLSSQVNDMEQQLYLLRDDYIKGFQTLEQKLNAVDPPVQNADSPVADQPPTNKDETTDVDTVPEQPDGGEEFAVCEYTYELKNNFAVLTAYLGNDEHVVVPAAVDGYLVIALADRTFANCNVRSVELPETIESIGWFTFFGCNTLEKVTLPEKLSAIGYASFDGCASTLCLYVPSGSYAERFANSFGLRYEPIA